MPGQSQRSADTAIDRILEDRDELVSLKGVLFRISAERARLTHREEMKRAVLTEEAAALEDIIAAKKKSIASAEKALGVKGRQRLDTLRGDGFLRLRMNARALKARIRAKVIDHKFERRKLERAYRHQVMRKSSHVILDQSLCL